MAVLELATPGDFPRFSYQSTLDGVVFGIELFWSDREGRWYLNLRDTGGAELRMGVPLTANAPLLLRMAQSSRPAGEIVVGDLNDDPEDPTRDELGNSKILTYIDAAEIASLEVG